MTMRLIGHCRDKALFWLLAPLVFPALVGAIVLANAFMPHVYEDEAGAWIRREGAKRRRKELKPVCLRVR